MPAASDAASAAVVVPECSSSAAGSGRHDACQSHHSCHPSAVCGDHHPESESAADSCSWTGSAGSDET